MPPRNTYHLTWVSFTLEEGYLLTDTPPDLERGVAPLRPFAPMKQFHLLPCSTSSSLDVGWLLYGGAPDLRGGVDLPHKRERIYPLRRAPYLGLMWESSSPPLLRCPSLALSVATCDLW